MLDTFTGPILRTVPLTLSLALLSACGGSETDSGTSDTGTASFSVTDAPRDDVSNVFVTFDRIAVKPADGEPREITLEEPRRVDLLTLQGGNAAELLPATEMPAGQYNWVRLYVVGGSPESLVVDDTGGEFGLYVPGNQPPSQNPNQRWIQLSSPFVVPADGHADFVIDVDLRKALVRKDAPPMVETFYMIRPSLRLVDRAEVATISGTVDASLIDDPACTEDEEGNQANAVYLFDGPGAAAGDVYVDEDGEPIAREGEVNPVTTASVELNEEGLYEYTIGFVSTGEYTLAFTCDAIADAPETDDDVSFSNETDVTVSGDITVDFPQ